MSKYIFILGHNPALSAEELSTVLVGQGEMAEVNDKFLVFSGAVDADQLIKRLGGTIKVIRLLTELTDLQQLKAEDILSWLQPSREITEGKFVFGISQYGLEKQVRRLKALGLEVKKELKNSGVPARLMINDLGVLSSVAVTKNKLAGRELVIAKGKQVYYVGLTEAVQDFANYSRRDYGRPERDSERGMLPPKLAQIMINLSGAKKDQAILDPFCGLGTVLQEAYLMGFKNVVGSDKDQKVIDQAAANLKWLTGQEGSKPELKKSPSANLSQYFPAASLQAIITEPYMGPSRPAYGKQGDHLATIVDQLVKLYLEAFLQFRKILKTQGTVVMIWPIFIKNGRPTLLPIVNKVCEQGFVQILPQVKGTPLSGLLSERNTLIYRREGQRIEREVLVFRKK